VPVLLPEVVSAKASKLLCVKLAMLAQVLFFGYSPELHVVQVVFAELSTPKHEVHVVLSAFITPAHSVHVPDNI
jgi:hypothetical protein